MKKFLSVFVILFILLLSGCGSNSADSVLKNMEKKLQGAQSYYLEGVMEIMNHEDVYTYDVKVSYKKPDYYKVDLVNRLNHHEQVILKNDDGVYVETHKSFIFFAGKIKIIANNNSRR